MIKNIERISTVLDIPKNEVIDLVKNYINASDEIKRAGKNFVVINNEIKIIVNAASFKVETVKKEL